MTKRQSSNKQSCMQALLCHARVCELLLKIITNPDELMSACTISTVHCGHCSSICCISLLVMPS